MFKLGRAPGHGLEGTGHCSRVIYPRCCAAQLRGIAHIATLEKFVVYCLCKQIILALAAPQAWPKGHWDSLKLLRGTGQSQS